MSVRFDGLSDGLDRSGAVELRAGVRWRILGYRRFPLDIRDDRYPPRTHWARTNIRRLVVFCAFLVIMLVSGHGSPSTRNIWVYGWAEYIALVPKCKR